VVEDNPQTRKALVLTLETLHYHPLEAQHGRAALAILDEHRDAVKLILSDAVMPEMGGAELLRALRERGWSYPVVVVSGYLPPEEQQQFNDDPNFVTWLTKPVDIRLLASTIAAALRGA
jgi:CheY-like chemotaxis protein